jgi:hypothetical protein
VPRELYIRREIEMNQSEVEDLKDPETSFNYGHRAMARYLLGDDDSAVADIVTATELKRDSHDI